jgi:hypothetical protein
MKPLGIDLSKLIDKDTQNTPFIDPACPGARIYITREDLQGYVRGGETFEPEGTSVPLEGRGHARIRCGRPVARKVGCAGNVVYFGLCPSCHGVEESNRRDLRVAANKKADK